MVASKQADVEWAIGDDALAQIAAGQDRHDVIRAAANAARRDKAELTWIVRTCEAFVPDQRRRDLPFALHRAVLALAPEQRPQMMDTATAEGWSARETRRQVLSARIAAGDFFPSVDDDLEDKQYRRIAQAWNRASVGARELFIGSAEEADLAEIEL